MFRRLKPYQVVVDVSIAVLFFLFAAPIEATTVVWTGMDNRFGPALTSLVGVGIAALFSSALAMRRISPGLALGIAWIGALAQMGLGRPPGFSDLAIFAVLYGTAAYGSKRVYWAGFSSALVGALVITVYLSAGPLRLGGGLTWEALPTAIATLVAAAFALGLSWTIGALVRTGVRARENRAAQQRAEAETAAEQERVRIARDMHDVVAHSLAVIVAQADGARYAAAADPAAAVTALGTISTTARSALADVRLLLTQLRHPHAPLTSSPSAPSRASGVWGPSQGEGPQPTIADLEELYAQVRAAGVELRVHVDPAPPGEPPAAVQLAVYRILQEALTNALRHGAPGRPVDVRLSWLPDRVELAVQNPMPPSPPTPRVGHGVIGMRERAQLAGGRLDAAEESGAFVVTALIPVGGPA